MIIGLAVVALVAAYGGFVAIRDTLYTPDKPVRALFAALADRDEAAIDAVIGCDSPLCRPGALQSGYLPPENFEVLGIKNLPFIGDDPARRPNTSLSTVSVRYTIAGTVYNHDVVVDRDSGGLFRKWRIGIVPGADLDVISRTMTKVRIAGAEVDASRPRVPGSKVPKLPFALPGMYTLTSADDPLLTAATETILVAGSANWQRVEFTVTIKPDVAEQVDRQIRTRIDACVAQSSFRPSVGETLLPNCYFDHNTKFTYTRDAHWALVDYPRIELQLTEDEAAGTGGVRVHTTAPGHATVNYEHSFDVLEPRDWMPTSATEEIVPRGDVVVTDGKIVWTG